MPFCTASQKYKTNFVFTARTVMALSSLTMIEQTVRYNESHVDALQDQIEHLYHLVEASEPLKIIGNDLIKMSDHIDLKGIVFKSRDKKLHKICRTFFCAAL